MSREQLSNEQDDPKYRCCCQFCHVKTGAFAAAVGSLTFATYFLIKSIAFVIRNRDDYLATTILTLIVALIWLGVSIGLLLGVMKEMPKLLIPFMVAQVVLIFLCAALGILCVVWLAIGRAIVLAPTGATDREPRTLVTYEDHMHLLILVGVQALVYLMAFGFGIWFYLTVRQCYRWLNERKKRQTGQVYNMDVMRSARR